MTSTTTASPTYTTGTTNLISTTAKGGVRSTLIDSLGNVVNTRLKSSTDTVTTSLDNDDSTNLAGIAQSVTFGGNLYSVSANIESAVGGVQFSTDSLKIKMDTMIYRTKRIDSMTNWISLSNEAKLAQISTNTSTARVTAIYDSSWTAVQMDTAGLGAMANSATVGWQSDSVGLRQWKCTDVKIGVKISMANTAPANDKAVYVYVYPIWYDGSTWYFASQGTTTFPTGANGTTTIASPNDLIPLGILSYTTQNMVMQKQFMLSNAFGSTMPDAFGIVLIDYSGAALHTTNHRIYYSLVNKTQR
jgi:hypothetical protein